MDLRDKLVLARKLPEGSRSAQHSISMDGVLDEIAAEIVGDIALSYSLTVDEVEKVMLIVRRKCCKTPLVGGNDKNE